MRRQFLGRAFAALALLLGFVGAPAFAQESVETEHLEARLVADRSGVTPGTTLRLGVLLKLQPHWHVYWREPGDSGLPPEVTWTLPDGFEASAPVWPIPSRHRMGALVTAIYEHELLLPLEVRVPETLDGDVVRFEADLEWLVCEDSEGCIPGDASLELTLPVSAEAAPKDIRWQAPFALARAKAPASPPTALKVLVGEEHLTLRFEGEGPWQSASAHFDFFPDDWIAFDPLAKPTIDRAADVVSVHVPYAKDAAAPPTTVRGLAVVDDGDRRHGYEILWPEGTEPRRTTIRMAGDEIPATGSEATPVGTPASEGDDLAWAHAYVLYDADGGGSAGGGPEEQSLLVVLLLAFVGGLILNIMPCVLPVLSLKILGFVEQAGGDPRRARWHGYAFAIGVVSSFLAVAGLLLVFRATGNEIGWGFQLQDPLVVTGLAFLMFLLGLNLAGVFEFGGAVTGIAGRAAQKVEGKGYVGSFGMGVLATVIATPCTAPFMGPAIGYALMQPAWAALAVFGFIGVGMAAPYVLLAAFPRWLRFIPKPGPWMITFKQVMAFPMFATVLWLVWVYGRQGHSVIALMAGLLLASMGAWMFGRFGTAHRGAFTRWVFGHGVAVVLVGLAFGVVVNAPPNPSMSDQVSTAPEGWVAYDGNRIREYQEAGHPVFLDFTADWCLTCKANEAAFLETETVHSALERHGVISMQADWTRRDERITRALASLDRSSVPLYVIVPAEPDRPAVVLRTAITAEYVASALDRTLGGTLP